jgi:peroxiredoxin
MKKTRPEMTGLCRKHSELIIAALLLMQLFLTGCQRQPVNLNGTWQGTVQISSGELVPFKMELKEQDGKVSGALINGDEKTEASSGAWDGRNLKLNFDFYDGELTATYYRREMIGEFTRQYQKETLKRPIKFWREGRNLDPPDQSGKNISGEWLISIIDPKNPRTWRAAFEQQGSEVTGTIIPPSGDWGTVAGKFYNGSLMLSRFDGINARMVKLALNEKDVFQGTADLGLPDKVYNITAEKVAAGDEIALPPPASATKVKNLSEPFRLSFPDTSGKTISLSDERFRHKVVIVSITGSWCPNCHDEVKVLNDLHERYQAQGLEVVGLAFEYTGETQRDVEQVKIFMKKHNVKFPVLYAGSTDEGEVEKKLPQLSGFSAYPTTIWIGRDGLVKKIHTGFEGPATGQRYVRLKAEMEEAVKDLLKES